MGEGKPMKAFVTGATGNVGRLLVEELLLRGWSVDAFVLPEEVDFFSNKEGVAVYQGDVGNRISVNQAMERSMPDVVFHLAAYVQLGIVGDTNAKEETNNINVNGTYNVLKSALEHDVHKAVYISSVAVFGSSERDSAINEDTSLSGEHAGEYGRTKLLAHQQAMDIQEQGLGLLVFLPGIVFGPDFPGTVKILESFYKGRMRRLPEGLNDSKIPLVYSRDLLHAIFAGIERNRFGQSYILVESSPTLRAVMELLSEVTGKDIRVKSISNRKALLAIRLREIIKRLTLRKTGIGAEKTRDRFEYLPKLKYRLEFDTSKVRKELNWQPSSLRDALRETVEWFNKSYTKSLSERT